MGYAEETKEKFEQITGMYQHLAGQYPDRMWFPQEVCDLDIMILEDAKSCTKKRLVEELTLLVSMGQRFIDDDMVLTDLLKIYFNGLLMDIWRSMITQSLFTLDLLPDLVASGRIISEWRSSTEVKALIPWYVSTLCDLYNGHCNTLAMHPQVTESIQYIRDHLEDTRLNATFVAKEIGLSPNYLSQLFQVDMNSTLAEYIRNQRIQHANYLLTSSKLPLQEIARQCGFKSSSQFTKTYAQVVGHPPSDTRRKRAAEERDAEAAAKE